MSRRSVRREIMTELPEYPSEPCQNCKRNAWYLPGDYYYGKKQYLCGVCSPPPEYSGIKVNKPVPCPAGKRGRPALNISLDLICDTLRNSENVKAAAAKLGCSRGYIYKVAGKEKVRELVAV